MEVDFVPGRIVLDVDPAPPRKGHSIPLLFYCGHGRPSQLLLSSCNVIPECDREKNVALRIEVNIIEAG